MNSQPLLWETSHQVHFQPVHSCRQRHQGAADVSFRVHVGTAPHHSLVLTGRRITVKSHKICGTSKFLAEVCLTIKVLSQTIKQHYDVFLFLVCYESCFVLQLSQPVLCLAFNIFSLKVVFSCILVAFHLFFFLHLFSFTLFLLL